MARTILRLYQAKNSFFFVLKSSTQKIIAPLHCYLLWLHEKRTISFTFLGTWSLSVALWLLQILALLNSIFTTYLRFLVSKVLFFDELAPRNNGRFAFCPRESNNSIFVFFRLQFGFVEGKVSGFSRQWLLSSGLALPVLLFGARFEYKIITFGRR